MGLRFADSSRLTLTETPNRITYAKSRILRVLDVATTKKDCNAMQDKPPTYLSIARLRKLIHQVLRTDADLNAFLIDYFDDDYRRISGVSDREEKLTIFLNLHSAELSTVLDRLRDRNAKEVARHGADLFQNDLAAQDELFDPVLAQLVFGHSQRPLSCDRYAQWTDIDSVARQPSHQVVLLPGARNQGHEYFLLRVQMALTRQPPRRIVPIWWKQHPFPRIAKDFLAALALGLRCEERDLVSALSIHLSHRNLVLLHRSIDHGFADDAIVRYYTDTLPSLLESVEAPYFLKIVQPIEWSQASLMKRLLAQLRIKVSTSPPEWALDAISQTEAQRLIVELKKRQRSPLVLYQMEELQDITREHVLKFCELVGYPRDSSSVVAEIERVKFADRVLRGASSSMDILRQLARYLPPDEDPDDYRSGR